MRAAIMFTARVAIVCAVYYYEKEAEKVPHLYVLQCVIKITLCFLVIRKQKIYSPPHQILEKEYCRCYV